MYYIINHMFKSIGCNCINNNKYYYTCRIVEYNFQIFWINIITYFITKLTLISFLFDN